MLNLRHLMIMAVVAAALLAGASAQAQDASADQAKALLSQGIAQYNAMDFAAAKATLIQVNAPSLPQDQRTTLEEHLAKVDNAIRKQRAAMAALEDGKTALKNNDLAKAKELFALAAESEFLQAENRQDAKAELALVEEKIKVASAGAPAAPVTPTEVAKPVEKPADVALAAAAADTPAPAPETPADKPAETPAPADAGSNNVALVVTPAGNSTQPAEPQTLPPVTPAPVDPKAQVCATPEAQKLLAETEARKAKARERINSGKAALENKQYKAAAACFQEALACDPMNAEAAQGLAVACQQATDTPAPAILTSMETNRNIARGETLVAFDKAMKDAGDGLCTAQSEADYAAAASKAGVARNIIESNKTTFGEAEYREKIASVDKLDGEIAACRQVWLTNRAKAQQVEMTQAEQARLVNAQMQRERKLQELIRSAKQLACEKKYEQALEVHDQILRLDPCNSWSAYQKQQLTNQLLLKDDKKFHDIQRLEEKRAGVDIREAEIPWHQIIRYPEYWKELTEGRKNLSVLAGGEAEQDRLVRQKLQTVIPTLDFEGIEFKDVIQFLRDVSGLNFHVKWNALTAAGIDRATLVSVHLKSVTYEKALRVILEEVGGVNPLSYLIGEGVITISTKEDLAKNTYRQVYDIRDLIVRVPNFNGPRMDLENIGGNAGNNGSSGSSLWGGNNNANDNEDNIPTKGEIVAKIMDLIKNTVDSANWAPSGQVGAMSELNGQLVITQTAENHRAIQELISQLREAHALQVSVEARFISVSSGFLNSIGVDLDFYFNLGSNLGSTTVTDPWTGATVPTKGGTSGWGPNKPGNDKFTPMGVQQGSLGYTNMIGTASPIGGNSIGSEVTSNAMSMGGTFLDDIQVDFLIQATQAHSSTRALTAPRLTLFNGQRAYVTVSTQQAYIADLTPVVSDNSTSFDPTPAYVPTGSVLDVEATISADRRYVTLTVRPQVSTLNSFAKYFTEVTTTDDEGNPATGSGFIQLPSVTVQDLQTTVNVPDGGTLLLGGQKLSGELEREMGVPLLNKIPIVNRAFSNRGYVRDEQTLLILIKPKIIIQSEEERCAMP